MDCVSRRVSRPPLVWTFAMDTSAWVGLAVGAAVGAGWLSPRIR